MPTPSPDRPAPAARCLASRFSLGLLALASTAAAAAAGETGAIRGTFKEPGDVAAVAAIDRGTGKAYPATLDAASGGFTITGLPAKGRFDCRVDYRDGARLEGIDLAVPRSDYEEEQPLSAEDVAAIRRQVQDLNKFEDQVEILTVSGNIQHAAVLVNKVRTRPFVNSRPGEAVWRAELWHFERPDEIWIKSQDELFLVLYRQRLPLADYARRALTFDPALGGLTPAGGRPAVVPGPIARPEAAPGIRLREPGRRLEAAPAASGRKPPG